MREASEKVADAEVAAALRAATEKAAGAAQAAAKEDAADAAEGGREDGRRWQRTRLKINPHLATIHHPAIHQ